MNRSIVSNNETIPPEAVVAEPSRVLPSPLYLVRTGAKLLDVLEVFDPRDGTLSLAEVTRRIGLPKTSVLRLLRTLESRDYLERAPDGSGYRLGLKLFEMGARVAGRFDLVEAARPVMARLRDQCGDTINLAVPAGADVICVAVLESPHALRIAAHAGDREPAHCTALGKAILAHLSQSEVEQMLQRVPLHRRTVRTIVDPSRLNEELERVRQNGFALDDEEMVEGGRCVGAPIRGQAGRVSGAISISGPTSRLHRERLPELVGLVRAAALEISRNLGYRGPQRPVWNEQRDFGPQRPGRSAERIPAQRGGPLVADQRRG